MTDEQLDWRAESLIQKVYEINALKGKLSLITNKISQWRQDGAEPLDAVNTLNVIEWILDNN